MRVRILAVGRLKEDYLRAAAADYAARLRPYLQLEVVELPDLPDPPHVSPAAVARVQEEEGAAILRRMEADETLVALDARGRMMSSGELAEFIRPCFARGDRLCFAIGGSHGLGRAVIERADLVLSLSPLTFPHGLARLILLEQLYRAVKILRGEKYHK